MVFYKLIVAYDGTEYHGFQRQIDNVTMDARYRPPAGADGGTPPAVLALQSLLAAKKKKRGRCGDANNLSIQEVLESAILHLFPHIASVADLRLRFAGRTDKGVHAAGQVVLIDLPSCSSTIGGITTTTTTEPWILRRSLNSRLPDSISVESVEATTAEFDPRKDCIRKVYEYTIRFRIYDAKLPDQARRGTHGLRSALDNTNRIWICPWALRLDTLVRVCAMVQGTHDYTNFVHKDDRSRRDQTMTIDEIQFLIDHEKTEMIDAVVIDKGDVATSSAPGNNNNDNIATTTLIASRIITGRFRLSAASFRRSMVRLIVQFCVDASRIPAVVVSTTPDDIFATDQETSTSPTTKTSSGRATAPACGLCLVSVTY